MFNLEGILYVTSNSHESSTDPPAVPDEGFIGAEPKVKPTTVNTKPDNFSLKNAKQLERTFRSSPSYGRLTHESDIIPKDLSNAPKEFGTSISKCITRKGGQEKSPYLSQANLIESKARARNVPSERLLAAYDEKQEVVESHFPKETKDWQRWFVEAAVWGYLCMFSSKVTFTYAADLE